MHTTLLGQQEICRYLERGIKQQSLINIINRAGQKKKKKDWQKKKKTKNTRLAWNKVTQFFTRLKYVSSYR